MYTFENEGVRYSEKSDRGQKILDIEREHFMNDVWECLMLTLCGIMIIGFVAYYGQ